MISSKAFIKGGTYNRVCLQLLWALNEYVDCIEGIGKYPRIITDTRTERQYNLTHTVPSDRCGDTKPDFIVMMIVLLV